MAIGERERRLFAALTGRIDGRARADLLVAPPADSWFLLACRDGPRGETLLVAGTDAEGDHALALVPPGKGADEAVVAIVCDCPENGWNDLLGRRCACGRQCPDPDAPTPMDRGVLAIAFQAEPGARAILWSRGDTLGITPVQPGERGRCVIVDWDDTRPLDGFVGIAFDTRTAFPVEPELPFSAAHAAEAFDAFCRLPEGAPPGPFTWIAHALEEATPRGLSALLLAILAASDARRHQAGLAAIGRETFWRTSHAIYDRLERDPSIPPQNLLAVLSVEPRFGLSDGLAGRRARLAAALRQRLGLAPAGGGGAP